MSKTNLTHHFLIAAPELSDPRFEQALIYICRHDKHGALGLVINRPLEQSHVGKLLEDLDIEVTDPQVMEDLALEGGPMYPEVGFVLHTGQPEWASSNAKSSITCGSVTSISKSSSSLPTCDCSNGRLMTKPSAPCLS